MGLADRPHAAKIVGREIARADPVPVPKLRILGLRGAPGFREEAADLREFTNMGVEVIEIPGSSLSTTGFSDRTAAVPSSSSFMKCMRCRSESSSDMASILVCPSRASGNVLLGGITYRSTLNWTTMLKVILSVQ
jgi:hypothetical protein